jgi:hypothetical protein
MLMTSELQVLLPEPTRRPDELPAVVQEEQRLLVAQERLVFWLAVHLASLPVAAVSVLELQAVAEAARVLADRWQAVRRSADRRVG